ncbi:unnamed protein product [Cuscuta campestris]|uniref:Uncharacterized protein n=1 Tax=Cuscuta campestris TaxID=132261 RepID=A0A484NHW0_9ASTE|nr:unnamed protein product [Cuscuta campestris]
MQREQDRREEQLIDRFEEEKITKIVSISSGLMGIDIARASMANSQNSPKEGDAEDEEEELPREAIKADKLFAPIFQSYFEAVFRETEEYIREKLAQKGLLELLQKGLLQDETGAAYRITREIVKSMENVDLVLIKGTKYPVFLAYANYDADTVMAHNRGDSQ